MPFQPGQSGNPGGRPKGKVKQIAAKAREHAETVIEELAALVVDREAKDSDRIAAGKELLDRGIGKAINISTHVGGPLEDMNEDEVRDLIEQVRAVRAELFGEQPATGAKEATQH
jgi:hypothetical protein